MRYHGEQPKSHWTSVSGGRGGDLMKKRRSSVGAMADSKQEGQISKEGHWGSVNQSLCPRVYVVRGQLGSGAIAPLSASSE